MSNLSDQRKTNLSSWMFELMYIIFIHQISDCFLQITRQINIYILRTTLLRQ